MPHYSTASKRHLVDIHPLLVKLMNESIKATPIDFKITDGKRTLAEQKKYVAQGKSKTMRSRHLTGKAVDIAALVNGKITWELKYYHLIAKHIKEIAKKMGITITWGGDWTSFRDYVHYELNKERYGY